MYEICMKNTILYYKSKNALYKRHGWNYGKILFYSKTRVELWKNSILLRCIILKMISGTNSIPKLSK